MSNFSIYMMNTEIVTDLEAEDWEIDDTGLLTFKGKQGELLAVFNIRNIAGFRENADETE